MTPPQRKLISPQEGKEKKKKKKKIVSWKKTGQDLDIPAFSSDFLPPCGTPIYITPLRFPLAYPLSLFISQFLRLTANYPPPTRSCTSVKKATRSLHHRELCLVRPLPPSSHRVLHFYVAPVEGRPPSPLRRSFPPPRSYST